MKVQFEFSPADLAEVASRAVNRSPLVHRWRRLNAAAVAVIAGLIAFAVGPDDIVSRAAAGLVVALCVLAVTMYFASRPRRNARTEMFYRERLGGDGPFTCEVELTSPGVVSRQLGQELHHAWSSVASANEVPGGIELLYTPIGSLLVRDRAFADPGTRAEFLSFARSHISDGGPSQDNLEHPREHAPARRLAGGPTEAEYFVAWLLFFVCVSITGSLASALIGSGAAAILRTPYVMPAHGVYLYAAVSFIVTALLSYLFFRLFARRLVSRAQARLGST